MEEIAFAKRAAACFLEKPNVCTYTDGEILPGCLIALRWGLGDDCVLVLKLDESHTPANYHELVPLSPDNFRAEYLAIKEHAHPVLRAVMDISYVTGARVGDVLSIKLSQITPEGLLIRQAKTGKLQLFKRSPALDTVIAAAKSIRRAVRSLYLLSNNRGQPYRYGSINTWWVAAREAAGVHDVHFHDIRGKSGTDFKRSGGDYQALLGHTTKAMSDSYIKLEEPEEVEALQRIL